MFVTKSAATKTRNSREFVVLFLLIGLLAGAGVFLWQPVRSGLAGAETGANKLSGKLWKESLAPAGLGAPPRETPDRFKLKGVIAERYGVLEDPASGELMMHDSNGGVGVNTTSIEGDRAVLAREMMELDNYAEANRATLPSDAYRWLKKVAQAGAELSFGAPGVPPEAQPPIKEGLLAQFHQISSEPTQSILQTDKYLELEAVFAKPELAYMTGDPSSDFMRLDPGFMSIYGNTEAYPTLTSTQLLPAPSTLTLIEQPRLYNTLSGTNTITTSEIKTIDPNASLLTGTSTTTPTATTTTKGSTSTGLTSGVTAATYYDVTLAPLRSPSSSTGSSGQMVQPATATVTVNASVSLD